MRLNRFIGEYDLSKKEVEIVDPKTIKQIKTVLRLKVGDKIILSNGKGHEAEITLDFFSAEKITGTKNNIPARTSLAGIGVVKQVHLYLAILKKENFELAVQKAVECGVSKITPIITERTIKTGLSIPRLEKIILEASEQCGQNVVPDLFPILDFEDAIENAGGPARNASSIADAGGEKIIFHLGKEAAKPPSPLGGLAAKLSIFVGPEGGFTQKEIELAKNSSFTVASLGPLTLRGETAAIIGTYRSVYGF
ncbi:hypothetical protein A2642_01065 [Candidatus Nomurabacteria bacterium RIFCSPHIGHO2_01_FULL_39_10]|uniref:Ribosomal RNA small subunit methyltransferase E n=1 Tax=Candidatus Nomurabacteria bacterium RIFCSPHIGHO2_01_FULL_39_10 TaxID=1801733 RepID=A0A1F6V2X4_9BACT|nr:MAG: hypothetical protein A2642_01065 [Candidatus Nomurabacteria bacterium RIFCSPHIGHO2_01_FULL_39_10]